MAKSRASKAEIVAVNSAITSIDLRTPAVQSQRNPMKPGGDGSGSATGYG